jgi:hypothetical protein
MAALVGARERTALAEGPALEEAPPRHVEIKLVAKAEDRPLVVVLTELLDRLQVTTHFSTVPDLETEEMWNHPGAAPAIARAWIDLRERTQVTLYLTGDQQDRVLVRQVPLTNNLDEVAREEVAHIVEAAVDELLHGGQIGVEKKTGNELPPPITLPAPLPEPPLRLDVGFGYAAQAWKDRAPLHGPAGFVSLAKKRGPWRPGGLLSLEVRFPDTVRTDAMSVTFDQGAVRLLFVADHSLSNRWTARLGLGGGFDWVHVAPTTRNEDPNKVDLYEATKLLPMFRGVALARYAFAGRSELFFGFAADADVTGTRYYTETTTPGEPTTTSSIFYPWWIRPMALIGITADVLAY